VGGFGGLGFRGVILVSGREGNQGGFFATGWGGVSAFGGGGGWPNQPQEGPAVASGL